ncbi:MAG: hypothetical protein Metus_0734 [Candidatus Methanosuratincola subterraneus]|uniref:Uncharacterized protein n=1 Tax=Methanosuratincola subterraneus TaxID=2593994 RepID=A0A444L8P1_METS7|nr:MAG: hypothetical protein Metus_0734 [Candidatus Methanosuratincola subterraneus]
MISLQTVFYNFGIFLSFDRKRLSRTQIHLSFPCGGLSIGNDFEFGSGPWMKAVGESRMH